MPALEKTADNALETEMVSMSLKSIASINPVEKSIKVRIYRCPSGDDGDKGPTD